MVVRKSERKNHAPPPPRVPMLRACCVKSFWVIFVGIFCILQKYTVGTIVRQLVKVHVHVVDK